MLRGLLPVSFLLSGLLVVAVGFGLNSSRTASAQETQLEQGINATMQNAVAAFNRGDLPALARLFTDKGFEEEFFQTKSQAASDREFFSDATVIRAVRNVTATSTGATATVDFEAGLGLAPEDLSFIFQGGIWVVDGSQPGSAEVPEGASVVDLALQEFAFVFDGGALASGNFAFSAENTGEQEHEIVILQLAGAIGTADLLGALENDDESLLQDFGFLGILEPGGTSTAALAHPLDDGHYVLICFLPDVDGVPHAFKGMISEFTVGAASGSITPPSTGDGGLQNENGALSAGLIAIGTLMLVAGSLSAIRVTRS